MSTNSPFFKRFVNIVSNNLGKDAKLLFIYDVFDPTNTNAYKTFFPVVARIMEFPAYGYKRNTLTYQSESTWILGVVKNGIVVNTSHNVPTTVGNQIGIITCNGETTFTPVVPFSNPNATQAVNFTSIFQNAGLGYIPPEGGDPVYLRHFNIVVGGDGQAGIGSTVRAYVINGYNYQQAQIVTSPISAIIPPLWQQVLENLNEVSTFCLTYDSDTGKFTLSST